MSDSQKTTYWTDSPFFSEIYFRVKHIQILSVFTKVSLFYIQNNVVIRIDLFTKNNFYVLLTLHSITRCRPWTVSEWHLPSPLSLRYWGKQKRRQRDLIFQNTRIHPTYCRPVDDAY